MIYLSNRLHIPIKELYLLHHIVQRCEEKEKISKVAIQKAVDSLSIIITRWDWAHRSHIQSFITRALLALKQKSISPSITRIESLFKRLVIYIRNQESPERLAITATQPTIHTFRIRDKETLQKTMTVIKRWQERAKENLVLSDAKVAKMSKTHELTLKDSLHTLKMILDGFPQQDNDFFAAYIAHTDDGILQGVATANVKYPTDGDIWGIATNPDNLAFSRLPTPPLKGIGTALITHIAHEILSKEPALDVKISLASLDTAKRFYEKLGFTLNESSEEYFITRNGLQNIVSKKLSNHKIHTEEAQPNTQKKVYD